MLINIPALFPTPHIPYPCHLLSPTLPALPPGSSQPGRKPPCTAQRAFYLLRTGRPPWMAQSASHLLENPCFLKICGSNSKRWPSKFRNINNFKTAGRTVNTKILVKNTVFGIPWMWEWCDTALVSPQCIAQRNRVNEKSKLKLLFSTWFGNVYPHLQ